MRIRWTPAAAEDLQGIYDYLKEHDLTVSKFAMAARDNTRLHYDAKNDGPGYDQGGIRWEAP